MKKFPGGMRSAALSGRRHITPRSAHSGRVTSFFARSAGEAEVDLVVFFDDLPAIAELRAAGIASLRAAISLGVIVARIDRAASMIGPCHIPGVGGRARLARQNGRGLNKLRGGRPACFCQWPRGVPPRCRIFLAVETWPPGIGEVLRSPGEGDFTAFMVCPPKCENRGGEEIPRPPASALAARCDGT